MFQAMLCDDNEIILEGLSRQIDWEGLGICLSGTAADGQDAWNQMKDNPPDILITDIRMPYIDGLELSRLAKDLNPTSCFSSSARMMTLNMPGQPCICGPWIIY